MRILVELAMEQTKTKNNKSTSIDTKNVKKGKKKRKIKIRLKDPNDPESYICEIYDSSFEKETEASCGGKPKNFFDVLMGKESKQNLRINPSQENEEIPEETENKRKEENEKLEKRQVKPKNQHNLESFVNRTKNRKVDSSVSKDKQFDASSDDENLFEKQTKLKKKTVSVNKTMIETLSKTITTPKPVKKGNNRKTKSEPKKENRMSLVTKSNAKRFEPMPKPKEDIIIVNSSSDSDSIFTPVRTPVEISKLAPVFLKNKENKVKNLVVSLEKIKDIPVQNNVKLAPLFVKKTKVKNSLNQNQLDFLQNGIQNSLVKTKQKVVESDFFHYLHTKHLQQLNSDSMWVWKEVSTNEIRIISDVNKPNVFRYEIRENNDFLPQHFIKISEKLNVAELKLGFPDVNVDVLLSSCQERFEKFNKKKKKRKKKVDDVSADPVWVEKYKPLSSKHVLGNSKTVSNLKEWLESWKLYDEECKSGGCSNKQRNDSSDEFVSSDEDIGKSPVNTCLIQGEIGCGKTCLVYGLAKELCYNVLEINSSSRRNGKKILADLQEATQSHKVHHDPLTKLLNKKQIKESSTQTDSKISLILIDDVDVVFDEDDGFLSALCVLVQSSKRPVILTSNTINCSYLDKFRQHLVLNMTRPAWEQTCCFLEIVSKLEGVKANEKVIKSIVHKNKGDVRKCMLDLQFNILSTTVTSFNKEFSKLKLPQYFNMAQIWWNCNKLIFQQNIQHKPTKTIVKKRKRSLDDSFYDCNSSEDDEDYVKRRKTELNVTNGCTFIEQTPPCSQPVPSNHFKLFDVLSVADTFNVRSYKLKDGLSLAENMEKYCDNNVRNEISRFLLENSLSMYSNVSKYDNRHLFDGSYPDGDEIRWKEQHTRARNELTAVVPEQYRHEKKTISLTYLPILRNICRAEQQRCFNNTKRKNRFYHYIRSLGGSPSDTTLSVINTVFN